MTNWGRTVVCAVGLVAMAASASAQTEAATPGELARWDAALNIGALSGARNDPYDRNNWYHTGAFAVEAGRYWTPHLKTTISVGRTGDGEFYTQYPAGATSQNASAFVYEDHLLQRTHLSGALSYQFFENTWVHPYVAAGVERGWERDHVFTYAPGNGRLAPQPLESIRHGTDVRPFVGGGAKFYVAPRAFVRGDVSSRPIDERNPGRLERRRRYRLHQGGWGK